MIYMELKQWLQIPCLETEVKGDEKTGYYIPVEILKSKIKYMEDTFDVVVQYSNFQHFIFNHFDKEQFASGSIEVHIQSAAKWGIITDKIFSKRLVGAYTFPLIKYNTFESPNTYYANTLKSLAIRNAFLEYPQFGSLLNNKELSIEPESKKKKTEKVRDSLANTIKSLGK